MGEQSPTTLPDAQTLADAIGTLHRVIYAPTTPTKQVAHLCVAKAFLELLRREATPREPVIDMPPARPPATAPETLPLALVYDAIVPTKTTRPKRPRV